VIAGDDVIAGDQVIANGDVRQGRTGDGLVKAAVYAICSNSSSSIYRDFNNHATTSIYNGAGAGQCTIDLNFQVSDRYWVAMGAASTGARIVSCVESTTNDRLDCTRYDNAGNGTNGAIMVTVY
jgi:hypothetical protein